MKRHIYLVTICCLIMASCQNHCLAMNRFLPSFVTRSMALLKSTPKTSITAALAGTCALGYGAFHFLREWKIKNEKRRTINKMRIVLEGGNARDVDEQVYHINTGMTVWGKRWNLTFKIGNRQGKAVWQFMNENGSLFAEIDSHQKTD